MIPFEFLEIQIEWFVFCHREFQWFFRICIEVLSIWQIIVILKPRRYENHYSQEKSKLLIDAPRGAA